MRAKRSTLLLLTFALIGAACGGDSGPASEGSGSVTLWVPAAMHVGDFLRDEVALPLADEGIDVSVVEDDVSLDAIEATVRAGVAADLVVVPIGVGQDLLAEGSLGAPWTTLWDAGLEADGTVVLPEVNLGVVIATPTDAALSLGAPGPERIRPVEWRDGCWVNEVRATALVGALAESAAASRTIAVAEEAGDAATKQIIKIGAGEILKRTFVSAEHEFYKRYGPGIVGRALLQTGGAEALTSALGSRAAAEVSLRVSSQAVGRINLVVAVAMTSRDLYNYFEAAYEAETAKFAATASGFDTFYDVMEQIGTLRRNAAELQNQLASCQLDTDTARADLDRLRTRLTQRITNATEVTTGIANQWGSPPVDQLYEAWDTRVRGFNETARRVTAAIAAKDASSKADDDQNALLLLSDRVRAEEVAAAQVAEQLVDKQAWDAIAQLLVGVDSDNPFIHSNGQDTATAEGAVDIVGHAGYWLDVTGPSADTLFGPGGPFACGSDGFTVLCYEQPAFPIGRALVLTSIYNGVVETSGLSLAHQYGTVLDADGQPAGNYEANADYPKDTYKDTDSWFQLVGPMGGDLMLEHIVVDGTPQMRPTDARAVVHGNSITLIVPSSDVQPGATWRSTAFRHTGDYGQNGGPFSGDAVPPVDAPLLAIEDVSLPASTALLP